MTSLVLKVLVVLSGICERTLGRPGETADLAISQAVIDEREKFAGRGDLGDAGAAPLREAVSIDLDLGGAAPARPLEADTTP